VRPRTAYRRLWFSCPSLTNNNVLTNGPKGYACAAHSSKEGKAFGACTKGAAQNPSSGFTWSGLP
jgi:hypothetical protein